MLKELVISRLKDTDAWRLVHDSKVRCNKGARISDVLNTHNIELLGIDKLDFDAAVYSTFEESDPTLAKVFEKLEEALGCAI